ncbi:MAG: response regulator [Myxococcaceae bacterium]|nr:response regulator [Myxococcaceae bacterium]
MAQQRNILIADPDLEAVRQLSRALRQRGYSVHYAPDGSRALEVSVLRHPDLTLFDEACTLLDAKTFIQILRTNPRTADIPVVLTTASLDGDKIRGFRDGVLKKPFNIDEVLARIDHIFRRAEAAKDLKSESEIEGSLTQLGIPDLLQILAMNKRSGKLALSRGSERGEIHVGEGRPMNAKTGTVEGEKALFRLLSWAEGNFSFTPGPPPARARINRAMDDALLEGMRQADEVARVLPSLPPRNARIHLAPEVDLPKDQHPVTSQVVELLRQPRVLSELVDLAPATDLEVLTVLHTLMQKGVVRIAESEHDAAASGPLIGPAEIHALRARLFRGRAPVRTAVAKVFVCGNGPQAARRIIAGVPNLQLVAAEPAAITSGFGTLGRYEISEALQIDFCVLPPVEAARPLWRPFSAGALGALVLDDSDQAAKVARWLANELRVPLVVVGGQVPPSLQSAPAGAVAVGNDLLEALRSLLIQAMNPAQGALDQGMVTGAAPVPDAVPLATA